MNKYGQYCPLARAAEILGDRWTLLVVRNLLCGAEHFNELERGLPGIPRALLAERLRRLQRVGVVEKMTAARGRKTTYRLTPAGCELSDVVEALTRWAARWAFGEPEPEELDPVLLLWWMRDRVFKDRLPNGQVVVEFAFREARPSRYWLVLSPADVSVCITHPGFEVDVVVTADLAAMYQVWVGRMSFDEALRREKIALDAVPALQRDFPNWFALSPIAGIVRKVEEERALAA